MKIRNKIISLSAAAACLAVMIAVAALAAGVGRGPRPDVLAQAAATDGPILTEETMTVFAAEKGVYYHADEHCSGMENARAMTEREAMQLSKKPCPVCIPSTCPGHDGDEIEFVYYSQGGKYFHKTQTCSGDTFDLREDYFALTGAYPEKEACPVCFPDGIQTCLHGRAFVKEPLLPESEVYDASEAEKENIADGQILFMVSSPEYVHEENVSCDSTPETEAYDGPVLETVPEETAVQADAPTVYVKYGASIGSYHRLQNCGGRDFRREITQSQAIKENFSPCPACTYGEIYYTENGVCYHSNDTCQGMMNAQACSRKESKFDQKLPCRLCLNVYCTQNGAYFHVQEKCMGMQNAQLIAQNTAIALGKQRCPVCWSPFTVYATEKGNYFHADQYCSGMEGAQASNAEYEWNMGKHPCPVCIGITPPETASAKARPENYDLFTTAFGQEIEDLFPGYAYDHSSNSSWILSNGDENYDIEACAVYPNGTAFFGEELPGLPELHVRLPFDPAQVQLFMRSTPAPIANMYAAAAAEIEKKAGTGSAEEMPLAAIIVYYDENRRVRRCEMQFGSGFTDHMKLAWEAKSNGQIELTQSEYLKA